MIYRQLAYCLPFRTFTKWRVRQGKEDATRIGERFGIASKAKPEGFLVWFHSVSVGEVALVMPLMEALLTRYPPKRGNPKGGGNPKQTKQHIAILLTTNTLDSARYVAQYLKANPKFRSRVIHQFICWDNPRFVANFLAHWKPDLALWAESELWPMLVTQTAKVCPLVLVNGHLSAKSYKRWRMLKALSIGSRGIGGKVFGAFKLCLAQNKQQAKRFRALGVKKVVNAPSLKYAAPPPPATTHFNKIKQALSKTGGKAGSDYPLWVAVSTHKGEDQKLLQAQQLSQTKPLLVLIPRHPKRGGEVHRLAQQNGFTSHLRSRKATPRANTQVYVIDRLGEIGLWCRFARVVFVGGSWVDLGGHNPLEPLNCGVGTIAFGGSTHRFGEVYKELVRHKVGVEVTSPAMLARVVDYPPPSGDFSIATKKRQSLEIYLNTLKPYLKIA